MNEMRYRLLYTDKQQLGKIIEKMYDPRDFEILEGKFNQMLDEKRQLKGTQVGTRTNPNDISRVSANSYTNAAALGPMMITA